MNCQVVDTSILSWVDVATSLPSWEVFDTFQTASIGANTALTMLLSLDWVALCILAVSVGILAAVRLSTVAVRVLLVGSNVLLGLEGIPGTLISR